MGIGLLAALANAQAADVPAGMVKPVAKAPASEQSVNLKPSQLSTPPATSTIHWAVNKDGSVELSDRPVSGSPVRQGVERFANSSDESALARARRERDYWRQQSDGFASRQRDRDRELEQRREAALQRAERDMYASSPYYFVPGLYRGRGAGLHPGWNPAQNNPVGLNGTFPSAAQTAALGGGPSPFLSSGFARDVRR